VSEALSRLVGFGRRLRAWGVPVGTDRILAFCRAIAALEPIDRDKLYWAGRTTLVSHRDHFALYDTAFRSYFDRSPIEDALGPLISEAARTAAAARLLAEIEVRLASGSLELDGEEGEPAALRVVASDVDVLRRKSFEELTDDERALAKAMIRRIAVTVPHRRARRLRSAPRGTHFDLQRTLRSSLKTHGEPFARSWRARRIRMRPLVLVLDVSGSMSPYARALMQFGYAATRAGRRVEVFCFGTRLTRVTRTIRARDIDDALRDVASVIEDWEGGTRIGQSLKTMLDGDSRHVAIRGALVVICSDGLERGDPALLVSQMSRLHRLAHRVIWVNPLKGDPRYEPLARGMQAALPYVDEFLPGHNIETLEALGEALGR
jgi:uncharacterized protein with von Willebrand factor type A (vWA) domain